MNHTVNAQATVITEPGHVEMVEVPCPEPGPGQVRVRIEGCGVCASNLPPWEGKPWFQYPMEPGQLGHEAWGRIDKVGEGVGEFTAGDRVSILSNHAYAAYDVADTISVVRLPETLDGQPFPGEPLGCAMNILWRSEIAPGQTVAIIGSGFLGSLLTQLISNAGAHVIALSRRPFALEMARRMGAEETISLDDHGQSENAAQIIEQVKGMTDGAFCDRVIEATGKAPPLDLAGELTRVRGRLIIAGYHQDGPRQINMQLWNWRGLDVINAHERDPEVYRQGMLRAVQAVVSGELDPSPLMTHSFPLERLADALDMTRDRPDGFMKAWVEAAL
jgi:threonine dehydrogenase-like Zn-dependent dehydrogenase